MERIGQADGKQREVRQVTPIEDRGPGGHHSPPVDGDRLQAFGLMDGDSAAAQRHWQAFLSSRMAVTFGAMREAEQVAPGVRRLLAGNPSPFTYTGTQSYIVGSGEVAVIDPGPDLPSHVEALLEATRGERIAAVVCTHTHRDHSPASRALKAATGAPIIGCAPLAIDDEGPRADASFDPDYAADRVLGDGETIEGEGWSLEGVATPGHTSNHVCLALRGENILFSGDHVMGWSTSIVSPPDGDMGAYLASLDKLLVRPETLYFPAHGEEIANARDYVRRLIAHRKNRETQILRHLAVGEGRIPVMVSHMYEDVELALHPAAERSVLAHLIELQRRGMVEQRGERWVMIV